MKKYSVALAKDERETLGALTSKPLEERDLHVTLEIALYMYAKYGVRSERSERNK